MECNRAEEGPGKQSTEKPLPRGLEQVSHLFLSNGLAGRGFQETTPSRGEPAQTKSGEPHQTVVLRPGRFHARDQLVSLLRKQVAALEEGMRTIDAGISCDTSPDIELLALDGTNRLAIVDLDDCPNDGLLLRGIDHFDWFVRNIPNLRRMCQGQVIDFSLEPRLFFVAPEFSPLFLCAARHLTSLQINCFRYHTIALSGGTGILFETVFHTT